MPVYTADHHDCITTVTLYHHIPTIDTKLPPHFPNLPDLPPTVVLRLPMSLLIAIIPNYTRLIQF